ncbi:MAG TPA: acyl-ACP--UDP-N-acetylglucosamine O-acyltransferase [Trueperaceae bacterium]|jgi:UDP-N-acetylglucosamine acyltransferase|nr:acyl-ACP--UDP-N-acetylglucosamine O-acyltransferase [Trueperaceae bacterium]
MAGGSAVVSPAARLGDGVEIGPFVVIEDDVEVGAGTRLLAGTVLHPGSRIGAGCSLGPYAVVGGEPMDAGFKGEPTLAIIEDGVTLRDFVTVHRATGEGNVTRVGRDTLVMSYAHLSHNCSVGQHCTITTAVQLGGHVSVGDHAVIGSGALLHQFTRVGVFAMFGAASAANQDVLPFSMARGNPVRHYRLNGVGLKRNGIDGQRYREIERALRHVRHKEHEALAALAATNADARELVDFIASSRRGVARFVSGGR